MVLSDSQAAVSAKAAAARSTDGSERPELDFRLADVVVAWNVFRHFYPYWTEAGVDWDARLRPHLESAYRQSREAHRDALRLLVADMRDGHGRVNDTRWRAAERVRCRSVGRIEGQVVVVGQRSPDAPVGAVVSSIDGVCGRLNASRR